MTSTRASATPTTPSIAGKAAGLSTQTAVRKSGERLVAIWPSTVPVPVFSLCCRNTTLPSGPKPEVGSYAVIGVVILSCVVGCYCCCCRSRDNGPSTIIIREPAPRNPVVVQPLLPDAVSSINARAGRVSARTQASVDRIATAMAVPCCKECGSDNEDAAKFCSSCGASLRVVCGECGEDVSGAKFCSSCGTEV